MCRIIGQRFKCGHIDWIRTSKCRSRPSAAHIHDRVLERRTPHDTLEFQKIADARKLLSDRRCAKCVGIDSQDSIVINNRRQRCGVCQFQSFIAEQKRKLDNVNKEYHKAMRRFWDPRDPWVEKQLDPMEKLELEALKKKRSDYDDEYQRKIWRAKSLVPCNRMNVVATHKRVLTVIGRSPLRDEITIEDLEAKKGSDDQEDSASTREWNSAHDYFHIPFSPQWEITELPEPPGEWEPSVEPLTDNMYLEHRSLSPTDSVLPSPPDSPPGLPSPPNSYNISPVNSWYEEIEVRDDSINEISLFNTLSFEATSSQTHPEPQPQRPEPDSTHSHGSLADIRALHERRYSISSSNPTHELDDPRSRIHSGYSTPTTEPSSSSSSSSDEYNWDAERIHKDEDWSPKIPSASDSREAVSSSTNENENVEPKSAMQGGLKQKKLYGWQLYYGRRQW